ncbi:MAG: replication initiation protein, partial [Paeniclostridium sordellii]|nr:replication initiation protein [Paeniclostridium sordellii]
METNEKNIVMKNNIIIKAKYNISTLENRIFLMLLYKLQKNNDDIIKCEISHEEFKTIIKKKQTSSVDSISDLLVNLRKQSIYFKDEEGWGEYGFINGFKYIKSRKTFKIEASKEIHTYIRRYLETGYTPINLAIFFGLINSNAQRFYDLLRLWSGTKSIINYRIDELKELLMIENKYDRYNDFKRRVILPAIKELNDTGYFEIDIKENKVGRKVDSIDFIVKD